MVNESQVTMQGNVKFWSFIKLSKYVTQEYFELN